MLKGHCTSPKVLPWYLWVGSGEGRETLQSRALGCSSKESLSLYIFVRFFHPFVSRILFNDIQVSFRVTAPIKRVHSSKFHHYFKIIHIKSLIGFKSIHIYQELSTLYLLTKEREDLLYPLNIILFVVKF